MSDDTVGDAPDHNPQTSAVPGTGPGQNLPATQPRKAQLVVNEKGWIAPNTVEEAARMAQAVIAGNLAPSSYNNDPNKIMLGIMAALEAGLPPLYGIRQIAIINGRPTIWGDAAMALIQSKNLLSNQTVEEVGIKVGLEHLPSVVPAAPVGRGLTRGQALRRAVTRAAATAGFVDPGFSGHVTLELSNVATLPIMLYPGMKIGQLCFFRLSSAAENPYGSKAYGSHYQGQRGPTASRSFQNFHKTPL